MENPTYRLEGVVRNREEPEDFEGPLTLILTLLSKNKIEIRDIKISLILDQYLEFIGKMNEMDLEVASEFVQMASNLLYIKTRMLLAGDKEVSELEELMLSLEQLQFRDIYARIQTVAPLLEVAAERGVLIFDKPPEPAKPGSGEYRYSHEPLELLEALASVFTKPRAEMELPPDEKSRIMPRRIIFDVRRKSRQLVDLLRERGALTLTELLTTCGSRSEMVAAFLSVLELCAEGCLQVSSSEEQLTVSLGSETVNIAAMTTMD